MFKMSTWVVLSVGLVFSVALSIVLPARLAFASLGGGVETIDLDQTAVAATSKRVETHDKYAVHELVTGSGLVREYVSHAGIVFGLAWNGARRPDLMKLLGSFNADYSSASRSIARAHGGSQEIRTERLVMESWGHMRNVRGHAFAPDLLPQGVSGDDIK